MLQDYGKRWTRIAYVKRLRKIGIKFANVGLINLTNLAILIRLAVLASQTNNNNPLGCLIEVQIIQVNLNPLETPLGLKTAGILDFPLRSINIEWIITFAINVATQAIVLVAALTVLTQTE